MNYPDFFNHIPTITLKDPLAELLGAFDEGKITYTYLDAVKLAGHSCPTVAGAYLMALKGLATLYKETLPIRGEIKVAFKESVEEGVTGVVANVITMITGATDKSGFKGLQGNFIRHSLLTFNADIPSSVRFTRIDTNESVDIFYLPDTVKPDPMLMPLLQKVTTDQADSSELKTFARLWQQRVEHILIDNFFNETLLSVKKVG